MPSVLKEASIHGKTLMTGKECKLTICPSEQKGIRFFLNDTNIPVAASVENVVSTDNCTVIGNSAVKVSLIEHFMAACAFSGIDSLDVCVSFPELPILDGSSAEWVKLLNEAGIEESSSSKNIEFKAPIAFNSDKASLCVIPDEKLKITYCMDFNHPELKNRWTSFDLSRDKSRIIEARTFGYLKDLEKFQGMGMALGVTAENTVGLTEDGYTTELRSEFEPIEHKILDLIGDLYLTGMNPLDFKAHIIAKEAGHKSHIELAGLIKEKVLCQKQ